MVIFLLAFNLVVMYFVIWSLAGQCIKVFTQTMSLQAGLLVLSRKQLFFSFPVLREAGLEIPVNSIGEISLEQTRVGYLLTARFNQDGKAMGVDLDINPLKVENRVVLEQVLKSNNRIKLDEPSAKIMENYGSKALSWKASFILSFLVISLALIIFPIVSLMLGAKL
ncbi:MAG: hypothetical protein RO469_09455 [Thermincola sp.]|nr:hypothetical protein [Thermincola sp.]MDT3702750.1 hypothetical protein [Thermincola sp.]